MNDNNNFPYPSGSKSIESNVNTNNEFKVEQSGEETVSTSAATAAECSDSLPLLLDPPLTEEEISADLSAIINEASDLEDLDIMIQSAGPFQHPRSVGQNYGPNAYHRQPSYHHHHHHQVSYHYNFLIFLVTFKTYFFGIICSHH